MKYTPFIFIYFAIGKGGIIHEYDNDIYSLGNILSTIGTLYEPCIRSGHGNNIFLYTDSYHLSNYGSLDMEAVAGHPALVS